MKVITIGRDTTNNVVINDEKVSRVHCQLVQKNDGGYSIVDLGSTNGTFVNGRRILGETQLQSKDVVRIGDTNLPWKNYVEPMAMATPTPVVSDLIPNRKRRIWHVVAGVVSLVLIVGGIGLWLHLGNQEERSAELDPILKKNAEITSLQLQAEADSLRREAERAKNAEEKERLEFEARQKQTEAAKIQAKLENRISSQTDTISSKDKKIRQMQGEKDELAKSNRILTTEKEDLTEKNNNLKGENEKLESDKNELTQQVRELQESDRLTKNFWLIWSSLDIRNDMQTIQDVCEQLKNKGFPESKSKDKDYIKDAFIETKDNDSKQYIIDVIEYTKDFNKLKIDSQIADRIIEQMQWTKQESVTSIDLVKYQFKKMQPEEKRNILKIISSVLKSQNDISTNQSGYTESCNEVDSVFVLSANGKIALKNE